jgi:hypothetical protein
LQLSVRGGGCGFVERSEDGAGAGDDGAHEVGLGWGEVTVWRETSVAAAAGGAPWIGGVLLGWVHLCVDRPGWFGERSGDCLGRRGRFDEGGRLGRGWIGCWRRRQLLAALEPVAGALHGAGLHRGQGLPPGGLLAAEDEQRALGLTHHGGGLGAAAARHGGVEVGLAGEAKALGGLAVGGDETDGEAGLVGVVGVEGGDGGDGFLHEFLTLLGGRVEERGEAGTEAVKRDPGDGGMKGGERFATMFMVAAVRFLSYWGAEMVVSMIDFNSS